MEILIDGDRGKLSVSKVSDPEDGNDLELGFDYGDECYFLQVNSKELEKVIKMANAN